MFSIPVLAPDVLEHLSPSKRRKITALVREELRSVHDSCQNLIKDVVIAPSDTKLSTTWDQGTRDYIGAVESVIKNDAKRKPFDKVRPECLTL